MRDHDRARGLPLAWDTAQGFSPMRTLAAFAGSTFRRRRLRPPAQATNRRRPGSSFTMSSISFGYAVVSSCLSRLWSTCQSAEQTTTFARSSAPRSRAASSSVRSRSAPCDYEETHPNRGCRINSSISSCRAWNPRSARAVGSPPWRVTASSERASFTTPLAPPTCLPHGSFAPLSFRR